MSRGVLAAAAAAFVVSASAATAAPRATTSYAFGRTGGNIVPFAVRVSADGSVEATGPVRTRKDQLEAGALSRLATVVRNERFAAMPASINCKGALPDFASLFVTVRTGAVRHTVLVHGGCSPRFTSVYKALASAVGLQYGTG